MKKTLESCKQMHAYYDRMSIIYKLNMYVPDRTYSIYYKAARRGPREGALVATSICSTYIASRVQSKIHRSR